MSNFTNFQNILTGHFREIFFLCFLAFFWCFGVSFSHSRAVSACFWHYIWHLPTSDICQTHSDTIQTLPDIIKHHPDTCIFGLRETIGKKGNRWIPWYLFNCFQSIWHLPTPDICQKYSDSIQTLPYLACGRPLEEKIIAEYHDIYSTKV